MNKEIEKKSDKFFINLWSDTEFRNYVSDNNIPLEFIVELINKAFEVSSEETVKDLFDKWCKGNGDECPHLLKLEKENLKLKEQIQELKHDWLEAKRKGLELLDLKTMHINELQKENELLKSKIENICSEYVSNELAYKIKEIIRSF